MCTKTASALTTTFAGALLIAWGSFAAQALPAAALQAADDGGGVTRVADRCGVGFHRGPDGFCRRNEERVVVDPLLPLVVEPGRACPLGSHLGPHRRECIPN